MASEFNFLNSLAATVQRYFPKRSGVINPRQKDIYSRMFSELLDPETTTEDAFMDKLALEPSQVASYHVLRNQLKEKLFNMLFLLDFSGSTASEYRKAIYNNARLVFLTQILSLLGPSGLAVRLSRSGLKEAKHYEQTTNAIHFLRILRHNAALHGERAAYRELSAEKAFYLDVYGTELEARELWELLTLELSLTGRSTDKLRHQASYAAAQAARLYEKYQTFNIGLEYYRIATISLELNQEFEAAEKICDEAKLFLDNYPQFSSPTLYGGFALRKFESALQLGDYKGATDAAKLCATLYRKGENTWFFYMEYEFQLSMHLLKFDESEKILREVTSHRAFEMLQENRRQRWDLFEYYLEFAKGKFRDVAYAKKRLRSLSRFRLTSTVYTKDKVGYNLPILIIEFLILLESQQYDVLGEKSDALRVYRHRYLKDSPASSAFIQFLIAISKVLDKPESMAKILKKDFAALSAGMEKSTSNLEGVQIIPYAWLGRRIIESMETSNSNA